MKIIYSDNNEEVVGPSVFLAGPSPRGNNEYNWRLEAIELFKKYYIIEGLTLLIPLPSTGIVSDYDNQVFWEEKGLEVSNVIMFWIPRDLKYLPAFTTNFEFGEYYKSGKVVYGRPDEAPKMKYLDYKFMKHNPDDKIYTILEDTIVATIKLLTTKIII